MDFASESNSMMGPIGQGTPTMGWGAISLLSERRLFRLYTAVRGGRRFVLKALREPYCNDPAYIGLLEREVALAMRLDHPNIVRVEGVEDVPTVGRCMVMERIDGVTLGELKKSEVDRESRRRIASELADALAYAHEMGVSHRDLKPDNVMITRRGSHVKVIDFGLGDADDFIGGKDVRGTRSYGAPEQMTAEPGAVDHRADVWSFGRLLEDLGCGRRYRRIARICQRQLPEERPSMADVSDRLGRLDRRGVWWPVYAGVGLVAVAIGLMAVVMTRDGGSAQPHELTAYDSLVVRYDTVFIQTQPTDAVDRVAEVAPAPDQLPSTVEVRSGESDISNEPDRMRQVADRATEKAVGEFRRIYKEYNQFVDTHDITEDYSDFVKVGNKMQRDLKEVHDEFERTLREAGYPEYRINEIRAGLTLKQAEIGASKDS